VRPLAPTSRGPQCLTPSSISMSSPRMPASRYGGDLRRVGKSRGAGPAVNYGPGSRIAPTGLIQPNSAPTGLPASRSCRPQRSATGLIWWRRGWAGRLTRGGRCGRSTRKPSPTPQIRWWTPCGRPATPPKPTATKPHPGSTHTSSAPSAAPGASQLGAEAYTRMRGVTAHADQHAAGEWTEGVAQALPVAGS
jgi:hypothetical protein